MRAAFALLADQYMSNFVRKLAWDSHIKYRASVSACRLPPHVSLKQPFAISDLTSLERYMGVLAASIQPFEIFLTELQVIPIVNEGEETGILWVDVLQTETLCQLHQQLNSELEQRFANTQADHDGAGYHFHMTVMIGGQPLNIFQQLLEALPQRKVGRSFVTTELAMFVYDEPIDLEQGYMTYKVVPIGR